MSKIETFSEPFIKRIIDSNSDDIGMLPSFYRYKKKELTKDYNDVIKTIPREDYDFILFKKNNFEKEMSAINKEYKLIDRYIIRGGAFKDKIPGVKRQAKKNNKKIKFLKNKKNEINNKINNNEEIINLSESDE